MDGFELMRRLLELQPGLDVILMTGSTDERDARLVRAIREKAFFFLVKPFDREVLLTLVARCLELRRLDAENRAHVAELESELAAARVFQEFLLPERSAEAEGVRIAFLCRPCAALCGDLFDYVLEPGVPSVLIADVSGHGASAAMLTGMVKLAFRTAALDRYAPAAVLDRITMSGGLFPAGKHVSAIAARIDPESGTLEYVNAGHPHALLLGRDGSLARLESSAPIVHPLLAQVRREAQAVSFRPGDRLLLYTDGMTEARDANGAEFGSDRLERAMIGAARNDSGAAMLQSLCADLERFTAGRPLEDDVTLAVIDALA